MLQRLSLQWSPALRSMPLSGPLVCAFFALGWLLPNHHRPWLSFHSEAWIAAGLLSALLLVLWQTRGPCRISGLAWFLFALSALPWLQHFIGILPLAGDAWVSFAFLLGFALSVILGELWASRDPDTPFNFLCGAIGFAAVASVFLQLYQWLGLTRSDGMTDIWVLYMNDGGRPYANLGQPNQLATLLIWGLVAIAWGLHKQVFGKWVASLLAVLVLFGLALTQSRTAMLTLSVLFVAMWLDRGRLLPSGWMKGAAALFTVYCVFILSLGALGSWLLLDIESSIVYRTQGEARLEAWRMFFDAALERPLLGYGWDHSKVAQLVVFPEHPDMANQLYSHAHNLFLDLVLWTGWPTGLALSLLVLGWFVLALRSIRSLRQLLLCVALFAIGVHAMLELPLHYAYFLFPAGVMVGMLNHLREPPARSRAVGKWSLFALAASAAVLMGVIVRDYFLVEESVMDLRFEAQRIGVNHRRQPPPTWLLRHWQDLIQLGRDQPHNKMTPEEVSHWMALVLYYPSSANYEKLLKALSMNGRHEEAQYWAKRTCAFIDQQTCNLIQSRWQASVPTGTGGVGVPKGVR
ncbi:MAG: O-antigen ligase C-terminal domain-containing protein [Ramlibacter sp.]|nr:O-antigen ligase C-terminal domain-containing protein [Ramlibacter sp.]